MKTNTEEISALEFLRKNEKLFNLLEVSRRLGGIPNFHRVVRGTGRLSEDQSKELGVIMAEFGCGIQTEDKAESGGGRELVGLMLATDGTKCLVEGSGLEYKREGKKGQSITEYGATCRDFRLLCMITALDRMADDVYIYLQKQRS